MSQPSVTFLENYIKNNVCSHQTIFVMPLVPAFLFTNIFRPLLFGCAWSIVLFVWLVVWLLVPCNPNLNCTATLTNGRKQGKDGIKALLVSFLISYAILFAVAISARLIVCVKENPQPNAWGGGLFTNIKEGYNKHYLIQKSNLDDQINRKLRSDILNSIEISTKTFNPAILSLPIEYKVHDVSHRVIKVIQSYTGIVNRVIWNK